ncbi:MAG: UDP-3-O-[Bacteroidales bacterium]|nr:UDP-3-O-[3-hydroxymyristoyl] N-acetylglucosamine deacetylase [Bacteroidales bacterium]
MNQTTIKKAFRISGHGLHTGRMVTVHVQPAPVNSGIMFRRTDRLFVITQPATADRVGETSRGTTLKTGLQSVATIEHLMSALHGMQIDNVLIELDGGEVPIIDGSARPWLEQLQRVGIEEQEQPRRVMKISEPIHFEHPSTGSVFDVEPSDKFSVDCIIDFNDSVIGRQEAVMNDFSEYAAEIAPCRTFVFLHEIEPLLHLNLIKGGSLDNALVFVSKDLSPRQLRRLGKIFHKDVSSFRVHDGLLNTTDRYFPNEPARHKLLDFVGDIRMVGFPPIGHFKIFKPGHRANTAFAKYLMEYNMNIK